MFTLYICIVNNILCAILYDMLNISMLIQYCEQYFEQYFVRNVHNNCHLVCRCRCLCVQNSYISKSATNQYGNTVLYAILYDMFTLNICIVTNILYAILYDMLNISMLIQYCEQYFVHNIILQERNQEEEMKRMSNIILQERNQEEEMKRMSNVIMQESNQEEERNESSW